MVKDLFTNIKKHTLIDFNYISSVKSTKPNLSNADRKILLKTLCHYKTVSVDEIIKAIKIYAIWNPDEAILEARKKGIFRYKAHGFSENVALRIIDELLVCRAIFNWNDESILFLETKKSISWLYDYYKTTEKRVIKFIESCHKARKRIARNGFFCETALFKELLVYIDIVFAELEQKNVRTGNDVDVSKNSLENYSQEEISEAISYIIFLYDKIIGIKDDIAYFVDPQNIKSPETSNYILEVCKSQEMQEWEVTIDYFNYTVRTEGDCWIFEDTHANFERSIRSAFVERDLQAYTFYSKRNDLEEIKMEDFSRIVNENLSDSILEKINDGDLTRYRFKFIEPMFSFFKTDENKIMLFNEELLELNYYAKELCIPLSYLCEKKVSENCSILDVVLFKRFFLLTSYIVRKLLEEKCDEVEVICQSLVPSFRRETLLGIIGVYLPSVDRINELIDIFTYKPTFKLDLQYTPILKASKSLIFPCFLLSRSSLLRNIIASSYMLKNQHVNDDGGLESLVSLCEGAFNQCSYGYQVFSNRKFKYNGQNGELDLIVVCDSDIILIECKCPLSPCNNFEMRASWDHVLKASKQLDLGKKAFEDPVFRKNFLRNIKINDNNQTVRTCIVFGNRLFSGYTGTNHPIRYFHELGNILNEGVGRYTIDGKVVHEERIWKNISFSHEDLIDYLSDDNSIAKARLDSMEETCKHLRIKGRNIIFKTFSKNVFVSKDEIDEQMLQLLIDKDKQSEPQNE